MKAIFTLLTLLAAAVIGGCIGVLAWQIGPDWLSRLLGSRARGSQSPSQGGDEERLNGACIGDLKGLVAVVPDAHEHGDVLGVELSLLKLVVERGEHGCR